MDNAGGRGPDPREWYATAREKLGEARVVELWIQGRNTDLDETIDRASERLLGKTTPGRP